MGLSSIDAGGYGADWPLGDAQAWGDDVGGLTSMPRGLLDLGFPGASPDIGLDGSSPDIGLDGIMKGVDAYDLFGSAGNSLRSGQWGDAWRSLGDGFQYVGGEFVDRLHELHSLPQSGYADPFGSIDVLDAAVSLPAGGAHGSVYAGTTQPAVNLWAAARLGTTMLPGALKPVASAFEQLMRAPTLAGITFQGSASYNLDTGDTGFWAGASPFNWPFPLQDGSGGGWPNSTFWLGRSSVLMKENGGAEGWGVLRSVADARVDGSDEFGLAAGASLYTQPESGGVTLTGYGPELNLGLPGPRGPFDTSVRGLFPQVGSMPYVGYKSPAHQGK